SRHDLDVFVQDCSMDARVRTNSYARKQDRIGNRRGVVNTNSISNETTRSGECVALQSGLVISIQCTGVLPIALKSVCVYVSFLHQSRKNVSADVVSTR